MTRSSAVPVIPAAEVALVTAAQKLASQDGATIGSFLKGLSQFSTAKAVDAVLPKRVTVTDAQRASLGVLAELADLHEWPTSRRELSAAEDKDLGTLISHVKEVLGLAQKLEAAARTQALNHLDVVAEREGRADEHTQRDKDGHYLLPGQGPGYVVEVTAPTPGADAEALQAAYEGGLLSRWEFGRVTRLVRVVDEKGFLAMIGRRPNLLPVLRTAITYIRRGSVKLSAK